MKVDLLGYASGAGSHNKLCKDSAKHMSNSNLVSMLSQMDIEAVWQDIYESKNSDLSDSEVVYNHGKVLFKQVYQSLQRRNFPITMGGDHSMAISSWKAATKYYKQNFGLIWIDAHMDMHTFDSSHSKNIHGMPLSYLLGLGEESDKLTLIGDDRSVIYPNNLCLIGVRSYEDEELHIAEKMGVKIFYMNDVNEKGLDIVFEEARRHVTKNAENYGISLDIDAFDPSCAPGTGTKEEKGIIYSGFIDRLDKLIDKNKLRMLEIAEFNHHLDKENITQTLIINVIKGFVEELNNTTSDI